MSTQAKTRHKYWEKITWTTEINTRNQIYFPPFYLILWNGNVYFAGWCLSTKNSNRQKFYKMWYICMKVESELNKSMTNIVMRHIMAYFYPYLTSCINFVELFRSWNRAEEQSWCLSKEMVRRQLGERELIETEHKKCLWNVPRQALWAPISKSRRNIHIPKIKV